MLERFSQLDSGVFLAEPSIYWALFALLFLVVYFLPSLVAFALGRKNRRKILLANIPAGLSWLAWFGVLAWAVSGKRDDKEC